jgi:PTS system cellobiose-specific IIA component
MNSKKTVTQGQLTEEAVQIATMVIIHAGNARRLVVTALDSAYEHHLADAKSKLDQAESEIREAHHTQTDLIQSEARGEQVELSLLLTHAQDSLMASMIEVDLANQMIKLYQRIEELEKEDSGSHHR